MDEGGVEAFGTGIWVYVWYVCMWVWRGVGGMEMWGCACVGMWVCRCMGM